jgi:predicted transposase YdaD
MEAWKQKELQEAEEIGTRKGRQEGRQEGEAALLLRQLERRFGVLPAWVRERVGSAETAALEEWGVRVLDAGTLDEVFV